MADIVFTAAEDPPRPGQRDFLLECLMGFKGRCSHMNRCRRSLGNSKMTQILQYAACKRAGFIIAIYVFLTRIFPRSPHKVSH